MFDLQIDKKKLSSMNKSCEKKTNFICLTRPRLVPTIYRTRGEHVNHYATDAVPYLNASTKWSET
jgi:hypothetical protein